MEDRVSRRSVDYIDGQRLTSLLLCSGRILIVFQHLLLLVTPATRPSGTYRGTCTTVFVTARCFARAVYAIAVLSVRLSVVHYIRVLSKRKKVSHFSPLQWPRHLSFSRPKNATKFQGKHISQRRQIQTQKSRFLTIWYMSVTVQQTGRGR